MAYSVTARCPACGEEDGLLIGMWWTVRGYCVCSACRRILPVPLAQNAEPSCPGCHRALLDDELFDWSGCIPRWGREAPTDPSSAPICLRCGAARVVFEMHAHLNYASVSGQKEKPWIGLDTMEKAIFQRVLSALCEEHGLVLSEWLAYYGLDPPGRLASVVGLSEAIRYETETHMVNVGGRPGSGFSDTDSLTQRQRKWREEMDRREGEHLAKLWAPRRAASRLRIAFDALVDGILDVLGKVLNA